ncbi:MAG: tetratricopeptide repeat protein [Elainellaceae cyanobacterium]
MSHWQGRTKECEQLQTWLADPSVALVGVLGVGGFGKSTLAARVHEDSTGFAHRFWANVSQQANFTEVARRILRQWGQSEAQVKAIPEADLGNALVRWMQHHPCLLIIDNLESLLDQNGRWQSGFYEQFFQQWLTYGEISTLLVTSREQPVLPGYKVRWFPLETGLSVNEGAALLKQLGIRGDDADLQAAVQTVSGFPLSLTLIAGQLLTEEPQNPHVQQLEYYGDLFAIQGLHRGEGQVSIEAILDWSFDRLVPKLQTLLLNVSVYRGTFNISAAQAQMPDDEISESDVRQLVKRSLLQELDPRDNKGERQFRFQSVVQEYLKRKANGKIEAHERAIVYYDSIATKPPFQRLDETNPYLEAFHHFCELGRYDQADKCLDQCFNFLHSRGHHTQILETYTQLTQEWQAAGEAERINLGWAWTILGITLRLVGEYQKSLIAHEHALQNFQATHFQEGEMRTLGNLGDVHRSLGRNVSSERYQDALTCYYMQLQLARQINQPKYEANALREMGNVYSFLEDYKRADNSFRTALDIERQIFNHLGELATLNSLGVMYLNAKDYEQAVIYFEQALRVANEPSLKSHLLCNLGDVYRSINQHQNAADYYSQALKISVEIKDPSGSANAQLRLGLAWEGLSQLSDSIDAFRNARELYAALGVTEWFQKSEENIQRIETALASEAEQSRLERRKDIRRFLEWIRSWCSQIWQWISNRLRQQ